MVMAPSLVDLCLSATADELMQGDSDDYVLSGVYELPSELFDGLLRRLAPLSLQKLQENLPSGVANIYESTYDCRGHCHKRRRCGNLDAAWCGLYEVRWPRLCQKKQTVIWSDKPKTTSEQLDDWQQMYWEAHLQDCVDAVTETALLPSYDGLIGEIKIPDNILNLIGFKGRVIELESDYLKFSFHCQQFGAYSRQLRLPNVFCVAETCDLFQSSKLMGLELQWIKSSDHVEGLCKLLRQNSETLKSVYFIHCKLSPNLINGICDSLRMKGLQVHGVEHFTIKRSSFHQTDSSPIPAGFASFLTSGWHLRSLTLCDDRLGRNFARATFNCLLDTSASLSELDLSENNISGFLSQFRWRSSGSFLSIGKSLQSLQSLRVLSLRGCNLVKDDIECLKHTLFRIPEVERLDLSDNPIGDGIRSLINYFNEISSSDLPFADLKLENCELTCNHVIELFEVLSTMKKPLSQLSIKGNRLGCKIGGPLGKFLQTNIRAFDAEDVGLGSSGFLAAAKEISKELEITHINISNNQGGIEAAQFISTLISHAQEIVSIDSRYNLMPVESLSVISYGFKASKGKLKHLDLGGNSFCGKVADMKATLAELQTHAPCDLNISSWACESGPYDNDP